MPESRPARGQGREAIGGQKRGQEQRREPEPAGRAPAGGASATAAPASPISARSAVTGVEHGPAGQIVELGRVAAAGHEELQHVGQRPPAPSAPRVCGAECVRPRWPAA